MSLRSSPSSPPLSDSSLPQSARSSASRSTGSRLKSKSSEKHVEFSETESAAAEEESDQDAEPRGGSTEPEESDGQEGEWEDEISSVVAESSTTPRKPSLRDTDATPKRPTLAKSRSGKAQIVGTGKENVQQAFEVQKKIFQTSPRKLRAKPSRANQPAAGAHVRVHSPVRPRPRMMSPVRSRTTRTRLARKAKTGESLREPVSSFVLVYCPS